MRKLLLMCMMAVPLAAYAEQTKIKKEVVCNTADAIYDAIGRAGEQPIWSGELEKSNIIVTVNIETQDWTVIQTNGEIACVIDIGKKFKFRLPEWNKQEEDSGPIAKQL